MTRWQELGRRIDTRIGRGVEKAGRIISRRAALRTAILTGATAAGAVALGQRPAFARVHCPERCGPSPLCRHGCPHLGCPPRHSLCKSPPYSCGGWCVYATGTWVHCTGYGKCGRGYRLCQDCRRHHSCHICICVSGILCRDCCHRRDVEAEAERIQRMIAAP